jgi:hypothetical protein
VPRGQIQRLKLALTDLKAIFLNARVVPDFSEALSGWPRNALFSQNSLSLCKISTGTHPEFGAESRAASAPIVAFTAPKRYK